MFTRNSGSTKKLPQITAKNHWGKQKRHNVIKRAISKAKSNCWRKLRKEVDKNCQGDECRITTQILRLAKTENGIDPITRNNSGIVPKERADYMEPHLSVAEITKAGLKLKAKKTPGIDDIPEEIVKAHA